MARSIDPHTYSGDFFEILLRAEQKVTSFDYTPPPRVQPFEWRKRFYAYRTAWKAEADRLTKAGLFDDASIAFSKYRALARFECLCDGPCLKFINKDTEKGTFSNIGPPLDVFVPGLDDLNITREAAMAAASAATIGDDHRYDDLYKPDPERMLALLKTLPEPPPEPIKGPANPPLSDPFNLSELAGPLDKAP